MKYANPPLGQRQPGAQHEGVAGAASGKAPLQTAESRAVVRFYNKRGTAGGR